ncbi:MAG: nucleotidyltransferase [Candidatus Delongbacteria bacterium]|nr:nucleotidyltransferase [Candidatus Delongbacteria bacterium]
MKLLNSHGVKYLLIGGYAVGYYGYPRATADMDIWVNVNDEDNFIKLISALNEFGISIDPKDNILFKEKGQMIRIGFPPVRIEVLSDISGVEFSECFKNKKIIELDGVEVTIISKKDLIKNKKKSARYKDLDDVENLEE